MRDKQTQERREIGRRLELFEHLDRESPYFDLHYGGLTTVDGKTCHEVILTNTINTDEARFYFADDSFFMIRPEVRQPDITIVSDYKDFRKVDGLIVAFYSHTKFIEWEKEEETWTTEYTIDPSPPPALFNPPERRKDYHFPEGASQVAVPFLFSENLIYITVSMNGQTGYWVLDSGASMSVIDRDYAIENRLEIKGSIRGYGFGELFDLGFVAIPEYSVGAIQFDSQKFYVATGLRQRSYEPEIIGILGYDFLSRFVVEINYDTRTAIFHTPEQFTYDGPGTVIDAPLKYRTFTLPVQLEGKYSSTWTLDLGSYRSSIHYLFAKEHDLLARPGIETVSQGVSGLSFEKTSVFGCLGIDGFQLDNQLLTIPNEKGQGATALGEVGGNLVNSTLKNFRLFLDYPNKHIILEKGKHFNQLFARDKSGLLIGRNENNQAMVSYIASGTPAEDSGLIAGDIITAINGIDVVPGQSIMELRDLLRGEEGTQVIVSVHRGEEHLHKIFFLKNLYPAIDLQACKTVSQ